MTIFETERLSQRRAAVITGIVLLVMTACAAFAAGLANGSLIASGDADATVRNIQNATGLFRGGILGWLVILVSDIVVSWSLYSFLKQVDKSTALLGALFRIMYCVFLGIAILNLLYTVALLNADEAIMKPDLIKAQVMLYISAYNNTWSFGLILFGLHLFIVGMLALKSDFIPKLFGILLLIAAVSYILIHSLHTFFPSVNSVTAILENILSIPMALGELAFGVWLLIKGGRSVKEAAK